MEKIPRYELTEIKEEKCEHVLMILSDYFKDKLESVIFDDEVIINFFYLRL